MKSNIINKYHVQNCEKKLKDRFSILFHRTDCLYMSVSCQQEMKKYLLARVIDQQMKLIYD